jgi:hypothetical protein
MELSHHGVVCCGPMQLGSARSHKTVIAVLSCCRYAQCTLWTWLLPLRADSVLRGRHKQHRARCNLGHWHSWSCMYMAMAADLVPGGSTCVLELNLILLTVRKRHSQAYI